MPVSSMRSYGTSAVPQTLGAKLPALYMGRPRRKGNMDKIFLLTSGSGEDGDEWQVISIHRTKEGAERAKRVYEAPRERRDGSTYNFDAEVEEIGIRE